MTTRNALVQVAGALQELPAGDTLAGGFVPVPNVIASGVAFTVVDNSQVLYGRPIVVEAGGILLTAGTGSIVGV